MVQSRLSHLPTNFCFLYNGHPLDPNVEATMKAADVAVSHESQYIVLIDNVHCNIAPDSNGWLSAGPANAKLGAVPSPAPAVALAIIFVVGIYCGFRPSPHVAYPQS